MIPAPPSGRPRSPGTGPARLPEEGWWPHAAAELGTLARLLRDARPRVASVGDIQSLEAAGGAEVAGMSGAPADASTGRPHHDVVSTHEAIPRP